MPRLFVAIAMPDHVAVKLDKLCVGLPYARWTDLDDFHLTLRFIGEVEPDIFYEIGEALAAISLPPFELSLCGIGQFPPRGLPRTLWVGIEPNEPFNRLRRQVDRCIANVGLTPERRKYVPHITIARFTTPPPEARLASYLERRSLFAVANLPISQFELYSSILRQDGAIHMLEAEYDFVRGVAERV